MSGAKLLRAVSEPTATATHSYRVKYHTSQAKGRGARRVRKPTIDPELAGMDDVALAARNVEVWRKVFGGCCRAAARAPVRKHTPHGRSPKVRAATAAKVAAIRVCNRTYGIPVCRLVDLAQCSRGLVNFAVSKTRRRHDEALVSQIVDTWESHEAHLEPTRTEVTSGAAAVLASMSDRLGVPEIVLVSAAILACAELFRSPKQSC